MNNVYQVLKKIGGKSFFFFFVFRAAPAHVEVSGLAGQSRAAAAGHSHSHSHAGIQGTSVTYTTDHHDAGSLTY